VRTLVGALALCGAWACGGPDDRARHQPADASLLAAVSDIEAGRRTTPLIGPAGADGSATVTFLAKVTDGRTPRIVSDVTGWGESIDGNFDFNAGAMRRVGATDWFSLEATVAPRARIEYLVSYAQTDYRTDPNNPRLSAGPELKGPRASEFVMPGYAPPREFADPPVSPAGALHDATFESVALHRPCGITIYTPPGYRRDVRYPLAVFIDTGPRQMPRVLDWLIAHHRMEPILAVFALPDSAGRDLPERDAMRAFLTDELPKWVSPRYGVARDGSRRAVLGISFGARDALDAAISSPDAYGLLGLLIPGRRITADDVDAVAAGRRRPLRVAILAGQYDRANLPTARAVRQGLAAAGHAVEYVEVPEGHSAVTFHHHLNSVLEGLFQKRGAN
jgi:enterochelin esterase-like enzyme